MMKRNPVENLYFKYNAAINKSQCQVEGCSTNLVGKHSANFQSQSSSSNADTVSISILSLLNLYDNQPILTHTESILSYWESKKFECPELYALSHVVMAIPTTQVSVERSFSSLKFVFGDLRSRLGSELLEKIMSIRANK